MEKGDNDPDGLEFRFLDLNGGTIRDTQGNNFVSQTLPAQHFAEHRVRGGLHAMRLEVSGSASEGEPFEIRVIRDGGFEEVAVAGVGVADSALPHEKPSLHYAVNGPGRRQFDFDHGAANEPGVRVSTRTVTPVGGRRRRRVAHTDDTADRDRRGLPPRPPHLATIGPGTWPKGRWRSRCR